MLEVSQILGVGTALRLQRDAWSMVKCLRRQASNEYPPTPVRQPRTYYVASSVHRSLRVDCREEHQAIFHPLHAVERPPLVTPH